MSEYKIQRKIREIAYGIAKNHWLELILNVLIAITEPAREITPRTRGMLLLRSAKSAPRYFPTVKIRIKK